MIDYTLLFRDLQVEEAIGVVPKLRLRIDILIRRGPGSDDIIIHSI
jgi:hypothetical protein